MSLSEVLLLAVGGGKTEQAPKIFGSDYLPTPPSQGVINFGKNYSNLKDFHIKIFKYLR